MSQQEALFLLCGYPCLIAVIFALLCSFWRTLSKTYEQGDTNRLPRYGKHPDMLDDKFSVKRRYKDNET